MTTESEPRGWAFMLSLVFYGLIYIGLSSVLISMNKYMMTHDRFPYALPLVAMHQGAIFAMSLVLFLLFPSMYPTMKQVREQKWLTFRMIFPLAVVSAASFVASNTAYKYVSVALLQILKEANIAGVFVLSLISGLAAWNGKEAVVLAGIVIFTALAVTGEIHYVWFGIAIQLLSQLFECAKIIFIKFTMSDRPGAVMKKLDPLTAVGLVAPLALILLTINAAIFCDAAWWPAFLEWKWFLVANCMVAFALNVSVMKFIQISSAIHFVLCGILKDIIIYICFTLSTVLIFVHAIMGMNAEAFAQGWVPGFKAVFTPAPIAAKSASQIGQDPEKKPLVGSTVDAAIAN